MSVYTERGTKVPYLETIAANRLWPGDIIRLVKGMKVPADCILIYAGNSHQKIPEYVYGPNGKDKANPEKLVELN